MAESDSSTSTCSSVTDDESVCSSPNPLLSGMSDDDNDDGFPSLSHGTEVLPYQFEPDPLPDESHARVLTDEEDTLRGRVGNTNW